MEPLLIGHIVRPHGVRGELVVETLSGTPEPFVHETALYLGEPPILHALSGARVHRGRLLISLAECQDRDSAEAYRSWPVYIARAEAQPLPLGTYLWSQILGLTVRTDLGEELGVIHDILETGANDVYVVVGPQGELLLPAAPGVVQNVDLTAKCMTVHLLEGLR